MLCRGAAVLRQQGLAAAEMLCSRRGMLRRSLLHAGPRDGVHERRRLSSRPPVRRGMLLPGEVCKDGTCLKPGPPCPGAIGGRCREGEQCATNGKCCPQERYTATLGCCEPGQVACKVKVWPPSGPESDPEPYIQEQCCPPGFTCADGACCPPGECCENNTPCPPGKHCDKGKCCAPGQRAEFDPSSGGIRCV